ncbi:hypothetical protein HDV00_007303 [Rhizophlyctis rosea]|nr:hypothetical protein HDV00_007303 [Rhizophlyctis rosea]
MDRFMANGQQRPKSKQHQDDSTSPLANHSSRWPPEDFADEQRAKSVTSMGKHFSSLFPTQKQKAVVQEEQWDDSRGHWESGQRGYFDERGADIGDDDRYGENPFLINEPSWNVPASPLSFQRTPATAMANTRTSFEDDMDISANGVLHVRPPAIRNNIYVRQIENMGGLSKGNLEMIPYTPFNRSGERRWPMALQGDFRPATAEEDMQSLVGSHHSLPSTPSTVFPIQTQSDGRSSYLHADATNKYPRPSSAAHRSDEPPSPIWTTEPANYRRVASTLQTGHSDHRQLFDHSPTSDLDDGATITESEMRILEQMEARAVAEQDRAGYDPVGRVGAFEREPNRILFINDEKIVHVE